MPRRSSGPGMEQISVLSFVRGLQVSLTIKDGRLVFPCTGQKEKGSYQRCTASKPCTLLIPNLTQPLGLTQLQTCLIPTNFCSNLVFWLILITLPWTCSSCFAQVPSSLLVRPLLCLPCCQA